MQENVATKERRARDLREELAEIGREDMEGVVFQHIRTGHEPVTIYAMSDGEPITLPANIARQALLKKYDGKWMFTDDPKEVPEYKKGTVRCFLHAESAERAAGLLDEIGLTGKSCPAGQLASTYAARQHGLHKHSQERKALDEFLYQREAAEEKAERRQQTDAMLKLAGGVDAVDTQQCDKCDYTGTANQVRGHKMGAHKD